MDFFVLVPYGTLEFFFINDGAAAQVYAGYASTHMDHQVYDGL